MANRKRCKGPCGRRRALSAYHAKSSTCMDCRKILRSTSDARAEERLRKVSREFGLSAEDYTGLILIQDGLCAICGEPERARDSRGEPKSLAVDHCHQTGAVRGLLCSACNQGLGLFKDNLTLVRAAAAYLKEHDTT